LTYKKKSTARSKQKSDTNVLHCSFYVYALVFALLILDTVSLVVFRSSRVLEDWQEG